MVHVSEAVSTSSARAGVACSMQVLPFTLMMVHCHSRDKDNHPYGNTHQDCLKGGASITLHHRQTSSSCCCCSSTKARQVNS
jgi:hypothetical protein